MKGKVDIEDFKEMEKESGITPNVLKEMPTLDPKHRILFNAWDFLRGVASNRRISISEMRDYLQIHTSFIDADFIEVIGAIDSRVSS